MPLVLFETSESVIEFLWDIALAFFIVRIALAYFLLTFASGALLTYAFADRILPTALLSLTMSQSELLVLGLHVIIMAFWARLIIVYFEVPRVKSFRLAIGGVASVFMLLAEALIALLVYDHGHSSWVYAMEPSVKAAWVCSLVMFASLPAMMMVMEKPPTDECEKCHHPATSHGHEKKSITAAVPKVSKSGKPKA